MLVKHLIEEVRVHNKTIYVTAQTFMYEFFEKIGFVLQPGEFVEAGLAHYKLILPDQPA